MSDFDMITSIRKSSSSIQEQSKESHLISTNEEFVKQFTFKLGTNQEFTINFYGPNIGFRNYLFNRSNRFVINAFAENFWTLYEKFEIKNRPATSNFFINRSDSGYREFIQQNNNNFKKELNNQNYNMHVNMNNNENFHVQFGRVSAVFAQAWLSHLSNRRNLGDTVLGTIMNGISDYITDLSKFDFRILINDKIVKEIQGKGFEEIITDTNLIKKYPSIKSALIYFIDQNSPDLINKWSNLINKNTSLEELEKIFNEDIESLRKTLKQKNESHIFDKFINKRGSKAHFVNFDNLSEGDRRPDLSKIDFEQPNKPDVEANPLNFYKKEIIIDNNQKLKVNLYTKNDFDFNSFPQENIERALEKVSDEFKKFSQIPNREDAQFNLFIFQNTSDYNNVINKKENSSKDRNVYNMYVNADSGVLNNKMKRNAVSKVFAQALVSHATNSKYVKGTIIDGFASLSL